MPEEPHNVTLKRFFLDRKPFALMSLGIIALGILCVHTSPVGAAQLEWLHIDFLTGNKKKAGTDAKIFVGFILDAGKGITFLVPDEPGNDHEKNRSTPHRLALGSFDLDSHSIKGMFVVNGMNGDSPGWFLEKVSMFGRDVNGKCWQYTNKSLSRWLDTKQATGPTAIVEIATSPPENPQETCTLGGNFPITHSLTNALIRKP